MANIVTNFGALEAFLSKKIDEVLGGEIFDATVKTAQAMGEAYVYGAYGSNETGQPKKYVRRGDLGGGLIDEASFVRAQPSLFSGELSLEIRNIAKPNPNFPGRHKVRNLAQLVELGDGNGGEYSYPKGKDTFGDFHQARPFMAETQKAMGVGNALQNIMRDGLKKRGLTVR